MAEAIQFISENKVIHADIKPDNILVDFNGLRIKRILLGDFGSSFSFQENAVISSTTPEYLAPEVLSYLC